MTDKRQSPRKERKESIVLQVVSSSKDPSLLGKTFSCSTVDVSASGLRIYVDHSVPVGCQMDLWVEIAGHDGKHYLSCEVKWCKQSEMAGWFDLGVELHDGPGTDMSDWRRLWG